VTRLLAALAVLLALAAPASAQTADEMFQDGVRAYGRGDFETAWFRFRLLADKGEARAQFNIGQLYREGKGVPADSVLAAQWYEKAARQGHALAQYNLGYLFEVGQGVTQDVLEARRWYSAAARQNLPVAIAALDRIDRQLR